MYFAIVVTVGARGGMLQGAWSKLTSTSLFKSEDQRKRESIIAKYTTLINRCSDAIAEIDIIPVF